MIIKLGCVRDTQRSNLYHSCRLVSKVQWAEQQEIIALPQFAWCLNQEDTQEWFISTRAGFCQKKHQEVHFTFQLKSVSVLVCPREGSFVWLTFRYFRISCGFYVHSLVPCRLSWVACRCGDNDSLGSFNSAWPSYNIRVIVLVTNMSSVTNRPVCEVSQDWHNLASVQFLPTMALELVRFNARPSSVACHISQTIATKRKHHRTAHHNRISATMDSWT